MINHSAHPPLFKGGITIFKVLKKGGDRDFFSERGGSQEGGGLRNKGGMVFILVSMIQNQKFSPVAGL